MRYTFVCCVGLLASQSGLAASSEAQGAVATVVQLYRDFAWTAVIAEPTADFAIADLPPATLQRYMTKQLTTLLVRDAQCAARRHEICRLDFDPIWASQDPAATELKIVPGDRPGRVTVSYVYPSNGEVIKLTYLLAQVDHRWRIDDILYAGSPSLKAILSSPP